jgi:alginate O-acetyltransferase complex protein AlgI
MLHKAILYSLVLLLSLVVFARIRSPKIRMVTLLTCSYALYITWGVWFAAVLLFSTVMNFLLGRWLLRKPDKVALWTGIVLNLAVLGSFKYLPETLIASPYPFLQRLSHLAMPLGVSFWTFQAMSYLFDLYSGEELDPTFFEFALYMVFFPVVISGPVCRMPDMLPQFRSEKALAWEDAAIGFRRIAIGVLMMQVARLLGQGVFSGGGIDRAFDGATRWSGTDVWCLAFGYGLQLFFNFAGYTHIAIGAARALGFTLPENFDRPFRSTSPSLFWTRWHMSLSFWIRDYVFFPLAVLRREVWWRNLALVIAMVLFGVWHKGSVLFALWGCYHGVLLVLHRQVQQIQRRFNWKPPAIWTPISWVTTVALVSLGWVFFRANSLSQAGQMLSAVVSPSSYASHFVSGSLYLLVAGLAVGYWVVLLVGEALDTFSLEAEVSAHPHIARLARLRWYWVPTLYILALLIVSIVTLTQSASTSQFMYSNF